MPDSSSSLPSDSLSEPWEELLDDLAVLVPGSEGVEEEAGEELGCAGMEEEDVDGELGMDGIDDEEDDGDELGIEGIDEDELLELCVDSQPACTRPRVMATARTLSAGKAEETGLLMLRSSPAVSLIRNR